MASKSEREYFSGLADLGCILCRRLGYGESPAQIHHIRRYGGKRDNAPVIPLCPEHHTGNTGVHGLGAKAFEKTYNLTQMELWKESEKLLHEKRAANKLFS